MEQLCGQFLKTTIFCACLPIFLFSSYFLCEKLFSSICITHKVDDIIDLKFNWMKRAPLVRIYCLLKYLAVAKVEWYHRFYIGFCDFVQFVDHLYYFYYSCEADLLFYTRQRNLTYRGAKMAQNQHESERIQQTGIWQQNWKNNSYEKLNDWLECIFNRLKSKTCIIQSFYICTYYI